MSVQIENLEKAYIIHIHEILKYSKTNYITLLN